MGNQTNELTKNEEGHVSYNTDKVHSTRTDETQRRYNTQPRRHHATETHDYIITWNTIKHNT